MQHWSPRGTGSRICPALSRQERHWEGHVAKPRPPTTPLSPPFKLGRRGRADGGHQRAVPSQRRHRLVRPPAAGRERVRQHAVDLGPQLVQLRPHDQPRQDGEAVPRHHRAGVAVITVPMWRCIDVESWPGARRRAMRRVRDQSANPGQLPNERREAYRVSGGRLSLGLGIATALNAAGNARSLVRCDAELRHEPALSLHAMVSR